MIRLVMRLFGWAPLDSRKIVSDETLERLKREAERQAVALTYIAQIPKKRPATKCPMCELSFDGQTSPFCCPVCSYEFD